MLLHGLMISVARWSGAASEASHALEPPRFFGSTFEINVEPNEDPPTATAGAETFLKRTENEAQAREAESKQGLSDPSIANPTQQPKLVKAEVAERAPKLKESNDVSSPVEQKTLFERTPEPKGPALSQNNGPPAPGSEQQLSSGAYGAEGQTEIRSQLRRAFIKTLPLAAKLDPSWLELDDGEIQGAVFELTLDQNGQLESVRCRSAAPHPALLRAAIKNRGFLVRGRFKIQDKSGVRKLLIHLGVVISTKGTDEEALVENKVTALGLRVDPHNKMAEPTGAYFTYDNGRHVELEMRAVEE